MKTLTATQSNMLFTIKFLRDKYARELAERNPEAVATQFVSLYTLSRIDPKFTHAQARFLVSKGYAETKSDGMGLEIKAL
jgi:hypothetical protein